MFRSIKQWWFARNSEPALTTEEAFQKTLQEYSVCRQKVVATADSILRNNRFECRKYVDMSLICHPPRSSGGDYEAALIEASVVMAEEVIEDGATIRGLVADGMFTAKMVRVRNAFEGR